MRIAIPTDNPGGMQALRSGHFGHCDIFTIIELDDQKQIKTIELVPTPEHVSGGCMVPVNILRDARVQAIVVGGMGARPLQGFNQVGIDVYWADRNTITDVATVVEHFLAGNLPVMRADQVCGGDGHDHH
jgi:predicted Fe-Mo cluster-binding NifX family protein